MPRTAGRYQLQVQQQDFVIDTRTLQLHAGNTVVTVEPKPIQLLALLVQHAGELVSKNEILDTVWAGRVVSESVIARCVNKLRQALGDRAQTAILTVHGYGYRLTTPVQALPEALLPTLPPAPASPGPRAGDVLPQRPHWRLLRALDPGGKTWLAQHDKTGEARAFKFALTPEAAESLKRELTLHRVLHRALGPRPDFLRLYDYNLETAPYFLELEHRPLGSLADWLPTQDDSLPLPQRLELAAQAAESLAAAHAVGVVHQDVKPENLLVAQAAGEPARLVWSDFGSGRVDAETLERWRVTRLEGPAASGSTGGTLLYLAPERLAGQPASVKSDLYSLGVLLYQLTIGDLSRPLAPGWERAVDDPLLRADIAACADTDPQYRLGDAAELARRLRTLPQRQVAARQQAEATQREQALQAALQSSRRRRRGLQLALAASVLAVASLLWHERSLQREQQRTASALATAESLNTFLSEDLLAAADPYKEGGGAQVTVAATLERAAQRIDLQFPTQPDVRAALLATVGDAYRALNLYPQAMAVHERGIQAAREAEGPYSITAADMEVQLAMSLIELDRSAEAVTRLQPLIERFADRPTRAEQVVHASARHTLGWALMEKGDIRQSEAELRAALRILGTPQGTRELYVWRDTQWDLAETLLHTGDLRGAATHIEAAYEGFKTDASLGKAHLGWVNITRAKLYTEMGQWARAESAIREMEAVATGLPPQHRVNLLARYARARWQLAQSRFTAAESELEGLLPLMADTLGTEHDWTISTQEMQVRALIGTGQAAAARRLAQQLATQSRAGAPGDTHRLRAISLLTEAELAAGTLSPQTLPDLQQAIAAARQREVPEDVVLLELLQAQTAAEQRQGQGDAATTSAQAAQQLMLTLQARGRRPVQIARRD